jgi:hypothetical protein
MALDAAALKALETTHGDIAHVKGRKVEGEDGKSSVPWEVVFRKPKRAEYKMFKSRLRDPRYASDAQEELSQRCVVYPSVDEYEALLEKYPAIPEAASEAFMALVGLEVEPSGK